MSRHALRTGEYLAIAPDAIKRDADGFFLTMGPPPPDNEMVGSVAIVHIRGALSHYRTDSGDSYEAIVGRVEAALKEQPSAVVFRIESPGGLVSGLNEAVLRLRKMSRDSGVRFISYVDEMAASAAYALSCACEEILAPPSAIVGSVGVISTLASMARKDAAEGIDYRIITSGARKADGHLHMPISDAAVAAERTRNAELAKQFFALAGKARGMAPKALEALQANIYLAKRAKAVGLIDDVMSYDDVVLALGTGAKSVDPGTGNKTDRRAKSDPKLDKTAGLGPESVAQPGTLEAGTPHEAEPMAVKLEALIKKTEAALELATDPKKRRALTGELAMLQTVHAKMIGGEEDGTDDDSDSDSDSDEGGTSDDSTNEDEEEESKAEAAAKKAEEAKRKSEAAKHRAKAAEHKQKAAEYEEKAKKAESADEEDEEEEEESEESESEASASNSPRLAAIEAQNKLHAKELAEVRAERGRAKQEAAIANALHDGRITPAEAKMLAKKSPTWAQEYIDTRKGVRVVNVEDGHLIVPNGEAGADLPKAVLAEINERIAFMGLKDEKQIAKLRDEMIANRRKLAANGAVERY